MSLALPPPSERMPPRRQARSSLEWALWLLEDHAHVLESLRVRHPSTLLPRPVLMSARRMDLQSAFEPFEVPPSLVASLSDPLLPRLDWLTTRLRRRLGRTRRLLTLSRLREQDPSCVRRNARRPGRTLIEKAGPRQQLHGVVRVERFDSTENRVLKATARRLLSEARRGLRGLEGPARRGSRARKLRALAARCEVLLARPELAGVGLPRPAERPSNALLGDPHYRTIWRAWQLLRAEEESFELRWRRRGECGPDLVLFAAWSALDVRPDLEPVPAWAWAKGLGVDEARAWEVGGPGGDRGRCWVQHGDLPRLIRVSLDADSVVLDVRGLDASSGDVHRVEWLDAHPVDGAVTQRPLGRARTLAKGLVRQLSAGARRAPRTPETLHAPGIDGLGRRLLIADGQLGDLEGPPVVAARIRDPLGADHPVSGWEATWCEGAGCGITGPSGASVLGQCLRALDIRGLPAVVVPDHWDALSLLQLRRHGGACWAIWRSVAAALAVADELPGLPSGPGQSDSVVLFVCESLDGVECTQLVATWDESETGASGLLWRRERPSRFVAHARPASDAHAFRPDGLALQDGVLVRHEPAAALPDYPSLPLDEPVDRVVVVGPRALVERCRARVGAPIVHGDSRTLARGSRRFLERYAAGLPTWVDVLPVLMVEAVKDKRRGQHRLWSGDRLVRPGQPIRVDSDLVLSIRRGRPSVDFPLSREDGVAAYLLRLSGPPLPLERDASVRIQVAMRWGLDGLAGEVSPLEARRFSPVSFDLVPMSERTVDSGAPKLLTLPEINPIRREELPGLVQQLVQCMRGGKGRADHTAVIAVVDDIIEWVKDRRWSGPGSAGEEDRQYLEELAHRLDWVLGLKPASKHWRRVLKGSGRPPKLSGLEKRRALRARAGLGIATNAFHERLLKGTKWVEGVDRVRAIALTAEPEHPDCFLAWLDEEPGSAHGFGEWADALRVALDWHRGLVDVLDKDRLTMLLQRIRRGVDLATESQHKDAFSGLCAVILWLLMVRVNDEIPPDHPDVVVLIDTLDRAAETLPRKVLDHLRAGLPIDDVLVDVARFWLRGHYTALTEAL